MDAVNKMQKILISQVFKKHESQVFNGNQYPILILWQPSEDSRIQVWLKKTDWAQVYVNVKELPDVFEFMRALNYKYGNSYDFYEDYTIAKLSLKPLIHQEKEWK